MNGEPILLIEIKEELDQNNKIKHRFEMNNYKAIQCLKKVKDKKICVLTIAGPQRSGKSFLANRILKKMKGFEIGPSTNPCTKGIWIWSEPIEISSDTVMLILDTEGLNSAQRDQTIDAKIFSLSILLSSMFVYNQLGHIDENSIETMNLVLNLSKHIQIGDQKKEQFKLEEFCPNFIWVLRDFSLQIDNSNTYLENILEQQQGNSIDIIRKNQIRKLIRTYFQQRECFCLVRPLTNEKQLSMIEDQNWNNLRPQFRDEMDTLVNKILTTIRPKTIQNTILNGDMFQNLIHSYLDAINNDGVPQILTSLESIIQQEARKIRENLEKQYRNQVEQRLNMKQMPFDEREFYIKHRQIEEDVLMQLENSTKDLVETNKILILREELIQVFQREFKQLDLRNKERSQAVCQKMALSFVNEQQIQTVQGYENINPDAIHNFNKQFDKFLDDYNQIAKGHFQQTSLQQHVYPYIFQQFLQYDQNMKLAYKDDQIRLNAILTQSKETEKRLKAEIDQYQKNISEQYQDSLLQNIQINKLNSKKDLIQKDFNKIRNEKEELIKVQYLYIKEKENIEQEKNQKIKQLKQDIEIKRQRLENYEQEIQKMNQEINKYKQKCDIKIQSQRQSFDTGTQMNNILRDIQNQINILNSVQEKKLNFSNSNYIQKIEDLYKDKNQEIQTIKDKNKQQIEKLKQDNDRNLKILEKQFQQVNLYNDQIKEQVIDLQNQNNIQRNFESQFKDLSLERDKINESLRLKEDNLQVHVQFLDEQRKQVEKMSQKSNELQQQLSKKSSENSQLKAFRQDDFPYILKETIKQILKGKSNLKQALQISQDDTQREVQDCFKEFNIKFDF